MRSLDDVVRNGDVKIIVLRAGCSYRERLEAMLKTRGAVGIRRLEFGTIDGIVGCVRAGLGVTLLPRSLVTHAWRDGRVAIHDLPPADAHVATVFIRRHDGYVSSALSALLDGARPSLTAMAAITS